MSSSPAINVPSLDPVAHREAPYCYTSNTLLAAALATVGVPLVKERPFMHTKVDGEERVVWLFQMNSADGQYETKALMQAWEDDKFATANPDHPFVFAKFALLNRNRLLDVIKTSVPLVAIKRGDAICLVRQGSKAHQNLSLGSV